MTSVAMRMRRIGFKFNIFWIICSSLLGHTLVAGQQRHTVLEWRRQKVGAGHFNVHKVSVFSAAESLEVVVKAQVCTRVHAQAFDGKRKLS